ncbi:MULTISPECIES: hypothetical protein [Rhizobium]|uniref:Uncharacterized protein n=1 Tax=Rhizobium favelukesii TaxID=348824 RepID=W6RJW4_9HYPH|nr:MULTISPECIES: hypothetical protein [Rhizobium]MCA0803201.1 hypothetical protein [Rhizobium sp. T1473]MCS0461087.1 hypothetical protein [Rhizobium favelukesii]UFS83260.1 hypothetical protein LPB79_13505 [Rhizobium sp. T136]CDM59173.1 hypothetical protein LPU83_3529 [Rhizobium favelukesii]
MQLQTIAPVFLVLAIALSWPRFSSIFRGETQTAVATALLTTIASAVSLSALGLAFAGNGPWLGMLIAAPGLLLGWTMRAPAPVLAVSLSTLSLAAYLQFGPATAF